MKKELIQRHALVVGLKPEKVARYVELHAAVWPEVLATIKRANLRNYSIHLHRQPDGRHLLFTYFEYTGDDFAADMARIAADPTTQRWWRECVPCLELLPDHPPNDVWSPMKEVFYLD